MRALFLLLACLAMGVGVPAQLSQTIMPAPSARTAYYDDLRDVLVCWEYDTSTTQVTGMWEFDGATWTLLPTAVAPNYPSSSCAFDRSRSRFVAVEYPSGTIGAWTWEWDGVTWSNLGAAPFSGSGNSQVAYHETRQRVMLFTGSLFEWDGVGWTLVPTVNDPPTWLSPGVAIRYGQMEYDARWDSLVLFGGRTGTPGVYSTYEWDATNSWVLLPGTVSVATSYAMWFDRHRGTMLRSNTTNYPTVDAIHYRDGARNWIQLQTTAGLLRAGCYDRLRNRYLMPSSTGIEVLSDTHPAEFMPHAPGCAPPSPYPLQLAEPWSRAWLGQTLAVEAATPSGIALLVMGFSDQSWQTAPLPIDLSPRGLSGCNLNVAPEATVLGSGTGTSVGFTLPIPNVSGLLGTTFWQQAFAVAPGANPAGMLASDSVRCTVGRFQ